MVDLKHLDRSNHVGIPDNFGDKASLKMSFLQDMLEMEYVDTVLIEEAFNEALAEYIKLGG